MSSSQKQNVIVRLTDAINTAINISDPTIASFILDIYEGSKDPKEFRIKLNEQGAEFPEESLCAFENIIRDGFLKPEIKTEPSHKLTGLSLPDKEMDWKMFKKEEENVRIPESKRTRSVSPSDRQMKRERKDIDKSFLDATPLINKIYRGRVVNMTTYGAFISIYELQNPVDGLLHISQISNNRINHPSDIITQDQDVFVKVLKLEGKRISLSMKNIDQINGEEAEPRGRTMNNNQSGIIKSHKRLTSPERWELKQLIRSGVISANDHPELDEDYAEEIQRNPEIDVEIELIDDEPPFLKGQTTHTRELSPIRVVKVPDGSLNRAAMNGSQLIRDRKEEKIKQAKEQAEKTRETISKRINQDPLAVVKSPTIQSNVSEWKKLQMSKNISYGKRTELSMAEQRESLPVYNMRPQLVKAIRENQFLVIVGETGSGKTTQITQYLAEEGFNTNGKMIGCTQPRRVAAVSVAKRVADEVGSKVGQEVGYTIRFEDKTSDETIIKYMTDGMLQREALTDPEMTRYSVIMLDEAHERTIATDILFALLKKACSKRPDLKIIVTSATLDSEKFSRYFNDCPIITIPGRTFPVDILYTKEPEPDYLAASLDTVIQIHISEPEGDILVFLTGQEEIDTSCEALFERMKALGDAVPELIILPVYSSLPSEMQSRIFEPTPKGSRKVILATNIAETSITIDGIYYVIDPGFVKINAYDPKLGMDSLIPSPISQAQAKQRSGRAGRTGPGKCYRLYTESAFKNEMQPSTIPEIQRQNLSNTILMLKAMGINNLYNFDFMDPPSENALTTALDGLFKLQALDDEGYLTQLGRKMAEFPMSPELAKTLITSVEYQCSEEILSIVAMLSVPTIFYRPREKQVEADKQKAKFHSQYGDHLTFLNLYNSWVYNGCSKSWCVENYVQERSMRRVEEVRRQLLTIMRKYRHPIMSCGNDVDKVRKTLCCGFFKNSAKRDPEEGYKTLIEKTAVYMHPSSAIFHRSSEYVIYHTLLLTTKEYMHCVTAIEPRWLIESAPTFFKASDPTKLTAEQRNLKIVPLYDARMKDNKDGWRLSAIREEKKKALGGDR